MPAPIPRARRVAEHEVMWIGRRPQALAPVEHLASSEAFATAVTEVCASAGGDVQDYVAAAGAYGSWLMRFRKDGQRRRIVWNGKDGELVLEQATAGIDWDRLGATSVGERTEAGFIAGIRQLLEA